MKKSTLLILTLLATNIYQAQSKLDQAIDHLQNKFSQEKTYILLDKNQYVTGDIIHFKAFTFKGYDPTTISSSLFVELYDRDKKLIDKKILPIEHGQSDGSFLIKEDLKEDIYFVRAYTTWMENFSQNFEIVESIPIYNPKSEQRLAINDNPEWNVIANPEGGNLIHGQETKIAVRYLTAGVPPKNWSGHIVNSSQPNTILYRFNNLDQNLALFKFTPKENERYQVIVTGKNGQQQSILLPIVQNSGVTIKLNSDTKGIHYTLTANNLPQGLKHYKIVGMVNNELAYKAEVKESKQEISSSIPIKISDEINGVLQLSIFNEKDQIVAQRLSFIQPQSLAIDTPEFISQKLDTKPRAYSSFDILPNDNYKHYSILINDPSARSQATFSNKNILSALWLTSDFSNSVYSPADYFNSKSNPDALDALLISEKWVRYDWNRIFSGELPSTKYQPTSYLSYKARLAINSRPLPNTAVNLIFKTKEETSELVSYVTDDYGDINLTNFYETEPVTAYYYLNQKNKKDKAPDNLTLMFRGLVEPTIFKGDLPATVYYLKDNKANVTLPKTVSRALNNRKNDRLIQEEDFQIEEVRIIAKKQDLTKKLNEELSTGQFNSLNATVFDLVNDTPNAVGGNILEWLQGRAAGVSFQRDNIGNLIPQIRNSPASLYLDEMKTDANLINSLPISDIALVKIFRGAPLIGNSIVIYTKRGGMSTPLDKIPSQSNKVVFNTYDKSIEFELPDFSKEAYKSITSDSREVLYWNPKLTEPAPLPPRAKFFNNDDAQAFDISIIGIGNDGKLLFYNAILP